MIAFIDERGNLSIKRNGFWSIQLCPWFSATTRRSACGDWCPMLEEGTDADIYLNCGGTKVTLKKTIDERRKK